MPVEVQIIGIGLVAAALVAAVVWLIMRRRETPEARERRRRLSLHQTGRMGDAMITGASETEIYYTYSIRGVQYTASQDIRPFRDHLPADLEQLVGNVGMKYSTKNPADSILICEEWSGLRPTVWRRSADTSQNSVDADPVGSHPQDAALSQGSVEERMNRKAAG
jgi:hypothetical protein